MNPTSSFHYLIVRHWPPEGGAWRTNNFFSLGSFYETPRSLAVYSTETAVVCAESTQYSTETAVVCTETAVVCAESTQYSAESTQYSPESTRFGDEVDPSAHQLTVRHWPPEVVTTPAQND